MAEVILPVFNKDREIVAWTVVSAKQRARVMEGYLSLNSGGYVRIYIDNKQYLLSHFVAGRPPPGFVKDHNNRDKLDNRNENLSDVTSTENAHNRMKQPNKSSQYIGVSKSNTSCPKNWIGSISIKGKRFTGSFYSALDAAKWRDNAALYYLRTPQFTPLLNGVLSNDEIAHPTKPVLHEKSSKLPPHITKNKNTFRVNMTDANHQHIRLTCTSLEDAQAIVNEENAKKQKILLERHLSQPILRNESGQSVIVLNQTMPREKQFLVLVEEMYWYEIAHHQWSWTGNEKTYPMTQIDLVGIKMHRFCWQLYHPTEVLDPKGVIDHFDHNKLNCMASNLSLVTTSQNSRNIKKRKNASSSIVGVVRSGPSTWRAALAIRRKIISLGTHDTEEKAGAIRKVAEDVVHECYATFPRNDAVVSVLAQYVLSKRIKREAL